MPSGTVGRIALVLAVAIVFEKVDNVPSSIRITWAAINRRGISK